MPTCSFCRKSYKEPKGLTVFTFDGRTLHYCSSKCRRNLNLKREARNLNWIRKRKGFNISETEEVSEAIADKTEKKE